ncbi:uncharacterized protein FOMMEDRAFT_151270 [Fomitiporia mediterranea MF3/22]|uniref:uncharacterized protein n=1 Tax=Fomitiporia mediterranea (strain MF3/22) TaxID=694068 RepID=UPI0004408A8F|nr:uncharacterized protein FOMMEDRAFT_151270 [Fomitiporia mediterranea MF3/22]EJD08413.1 hypothetical protein FOMMEDRAFT_151270 [Fomitiporia mediterranea MF3/22]
MALAAAAPGSHLLGRDDEIPVVCSQSLSNGVQTVDGQNGQPWTVDVEPCPSGHRCASPIFNPNTNDFYFNLGVGFAVRLFVVPANPIRVSRTALKQIDGSATESYKT